MVPRSLLLGVGVLVGVSGCVTKGDVQQVQDDIALFKAETARRDSARAAQLTQVIQMQQRVMDSLTNSRRAVGQLRGDLASDLYNIQQQLVQLQELTGQSQQRLSELRTQLEARGEQISSTTPRDTAARSRLRHLRPPIRCTKHRWRSFGGGAPRPRARVCVRCSGPTPPANGLETHCTLSGKASPLKILIQPRSTTSRWFRSIPRPAGPPLRSTIWVWWPSGGSKRAKPARLISA